MLRALHKKTATARPGLVRYEGEAPAGLLAALDAGRSDANVHIGYQMAQSRSGQLTAYAVMANHQPQAALFHDGQEWTLGLLPAATVPAERLAPVLASPIAPGSRLTAPEPLARKVCEAWEKSSGRPTQRLYEDSHFVVQRPRLPNVPSEMPIVFASQLGPKQAAAEMAFCWLDVNGQTVAAAEFEKLLASSDAVLWRPAPPVQSFHLFTELAPASAAGPRHILLGSNCGHDVQLPYLFSYLAHQPGKVSALVGCDNLEKMADVETAGFVKTGHRFVTCALG